MGRSTLMAGAWKGSYCAACNTGALVFRPLLQFNYSWLALCVRFIAALAMERRPRIILVRLAVRYRNANAPGLWAGCRRLFFAGLEAEPLSTRGPAVQLCG